jgi:hypothetical protein
MPMNRWFTWVTLAALAAVAADLGAARAAPRYDDPARYCAAVRNIDKPDERYTGPAVPDWVAHALKRATGAPESASLNLFRHAAWRCMDGHVLACSVGANIPCWSKADVRRAPSPATRSYCGENPDSDVVPAVVTGHETVFEWRCRGGKPVIVRQVLAVDARGYQKDFWYRVAKE